MALELLDLPVELLDDILRLLAEHCKIHLLRFGAARLICQLFNQLIEPRFYSEVAINFKQSKNLIAAKNQLIDIATKSSPACRYAKSLVIRSLNFASFAQTEWDEETKFLQGQLIEARRSYLIPAIESLLSLETVTWHTGCDDPYTFMAKSLAKLPRLKELRLFINVAYPSYLSFLTNFNSLQKLSLIGSHSEYKFPDDLRDELAVFLEVSTRLSHLTIKQGRFRSRNGCCKASFSELIRFVPFRTLTNPKLKHLHIEAAASLSITPTMASYLNSLTSLEVQCKGEIELWSSLGSSGIYLKSIKTNWDPTTRQSLFGYLGSYWGLEVLSLEFSITPSCIKEATGYGHDPDYFYNVIIPKHRRSLTVLEMQGWDSGSWCIRNEYLGSLLLCQRLKGLSLLVSLESVVTLEQLWNVMSQLRNLRALYLHPTHYTEDIHSFREARELFKHDFLSFIIDNPKVLNFHVSLFHIVYAVHRHPWDGHHRFQVEEAWSNEMLKIMSAAVTS